MTDPIPDEAVEAAARALCIADGGDPDWVMKPTAPFFEVPDPAWTNYVDAVEIALTAAAPMIAAQATADLRAWIEALRDEWSERTVTVIPSSVAPASIERLTWAAAADALDALLREGE